MANLEHYNMKKTLILALVAAALPALAGTASKNPKNPVVQPPPPPAVLSYDNVSVAYGHSFLGDGNSVGGSLSATVFQNIFATGGVAFSGNNGLDDFSAHASLGAHFALAQNLDLVTTAGAFFSVPDKGDNDTFFTASAGLRTFLGPVDTTVGATFVDTNDGLWIASVSFWVPVCANWDVGVGAGMNLEHTEDWSISGGFRYRFK